MMMDGSGRALGLLCLVVASDERWRRSSSSSADGVPGVPDEAKVWASGSGDAERRAGGVERESTVTDVVCNYGKREE